MGHRHTYNSGFPVPITTMAAVSKTDPTRTTTLRKRFVTAMNKRFRKIKGEIRKKVVTEDFFGRGPRKNPLSLNTPTEWKGFTTDPEKYTEFLGWLKKLINRDVLEIDVDIDSLTPEMLQKGWVNPYINSAYQRGIARAGLEMSRAGIDVPVTIFGDPVQTAFNQPFHMNRVSLIYTRAFSELKGITDTMSSQISRVLAGGIIDGKSPAQMAKVINDRVDKIGIVRARMLARTETIAAHHAANVAEYRAAGVEGVTVQAEWLHAADACPQCKAKARGGDIKPGVYSLAAIESLIPLHPNCRCMAIPWKADWPTPDTKPHKPRNRKIGPPPLPKKKAVPVDKKGPFDHTEEVDARLKEFEDKRFKNKTEFGAIVDSKYGEFIVRGRTQYHPSQIQWTDMDVIAMKGNIVTHNHPNGTSFSFVDIQTAFVTGTREARAFGMNKGGFGFVHKMRIDWESLKDNFGNVFDINRSDFDLGTMARLRHMELNKLEAEYVLARRQVRASMWDKIHTGTITTDQASYMTGHEIWKQVVDRVPWLQYEREWVD